MSVIQFKCPNCGGSVEFRADLQKFRCDYCSSDFTDEEFKEATSAVTEDSFIGHAHETEAEFGENTNLYVCDNCGAEIMAEQNTAATFCYYCHSPVALKGRLSGEYCPDAVIPFKFDKEWALEEFKKYCKKKWFLPSRFISESQLEKITGLYVPYWLADCRINAMMSADAKIVNSHRSGDYRITHTKLFEVERAAHMYYNSIPFDGSEAIDDRLMEAIEPYDYRDVKDFSMNYLSGFFADKYDVTKEKALIRIKERIRESSLAELRGDIKGYTSVSPGMTHMNIINTKWRYALFPVWFMTYIKGDKKYYYAMNGQTGKIAGILPVSTAKTAAFAAALFAVFGTVLALLNLF